MGMKKMRIRQRLNTVMSLELGLVKVYERSSVGRD